MLRPVRCPNFKGFAPYQQIKRQVHLLIHDCSNNIVVIWSLPPAIREATTGIFLWPASGLYDTIKGDEFKYNNVSHDPQFLQHLATSREAVIRRWAFRRAQRHASFLFCGSSPKTGTIKKIAENRSEAQ